MKIYSLPTRFAGHSRLWVTRKCLLELEAGIKQFAGTETFGCEDEEDGEDGGRRGRRGKEGLQTVICCKPEYENMGLDLEEGGLGEDLQLTFLLP